MSLAFPRPTPRVMILLIANGAMFVLQAMFYPHVQNALDLTAGQAWQAWRALTFQFLHVGLVHLLFNMLGLYFLGMVLEGAWGPRRFLRFYLVCGAVAGLFHVGLMLARGRLHTPLVGASGGVLGMVVACAILFPHMRLLVLFFPMPIRLVAAVFVGWSAYQFFVELTGPLRTGGVSHAAHLGGALAGAAWIWLLPYLQRRWQSLRPARMSPWRRKMQDRAADRKVIDRILSKVHEQGLNSLTSREKKTLAQASQRQREQDRDLYKA